MNKMMLTTIAIGVFAINTNTAMASQISEATNHTDVTLTAGSGKDVYPVVPMIPMTMTREQETWGH